MVALINKGLMITYIAVYVIYLIFGYDVFTKLMEKKPINYANLNVNSFKFLPRRAIKLSLLVLLFSAFLFWTRNFYSFIAVAFIHAIIVICYYIKFQFHDPISYAIHIFWALPVWLMPLFSKFTYTKNKDIILTLIFLMIYYTVQEYVYIEPVFCKNDKTLI